jgi:ribonuclease BN (tRNA processing enzyme)
MFDHVFTVHEYAPEEPFAAAGFDVLPMRLPHYTLETYGFRLSADGVTIAYSGDSGPSERLAELARGTDLFICEATLDRGVDDGQPRGHLSADEALAAASESGTRRVLLTHRPAELAVPAGVEQARDGLEIEL